MIDLRAADPAQRAFDFTSPPELLSDEWAQDADAETLAALPELSGPVGYLTWAYQGLDAAHRHLLRAVGDGDELNFALAGLLLAAGLDHVPAELELAVAKPMYAGTKDLFRIRRPGFSPEMWRDSTARWLVRGALAGQLGVCRAWLDMAMRVTGAVTGLPGRAKLPGGTVWVPVGTFEGSIRTLLETRSVVNPLGARLAGSDGGESKPTSAIEIDLVSQPELERALTDVAASPKPIRLLIAGPSGTGKGVAVDTLAEVLLALGLVQRPVWIPAAMVQDRTAAGAIDFLRFEINRCDGAGLLVFQGLDEILGAGEAAEEVGAELLRAIESRPNLHVVAMCDPGGNDDVFAANPLLARAFQVARTEDFGAEGFAELFRRKVERLGATVDDDTVAAAAERLADMRPFRNLRNGHLVSAFATDSVARADARSEEKQVTVTTVDLPEDIVGVEPPQGDPMEELDALVGLDEVKHEVRLLAAEAAAERARREAGIKVAPPTRHLAFTGNPGTAKTTVARLLARIYNSLELLSGGHIVEVSRVRSRRQVHRSDRPARARGRRAGSRWAALHRRGLRARAG